MNFAIQGYKPILVVTDDQGRACFRKETILGYYPLTHQQRALIEQLPEGFPDEQFYLLHPVHEFQIHIPADVEALERMVIAVQAYNNWVQPLVVAGVELREIQRCNRERILQYTYAPDQADAEALITQRPVLKPRPRRR